MFSSSEYCDCLVNAGKEEKCTVVFHLSEIWKSEIMALEELKKQAMEIDFRISNILSPQIDFDSFFIEKQQKLQQQLSEFLIDCSAKELVERGLDAFESLELQIEALGPVLAEMGVQIPERSSTPKPEIQPEVKEELPESPTLKDLGLSSLTIGLLAEKKERESIDSLQAPVLTQPKSVVKTVTENEFGTLTSLLQNQFTVQYLNSVIYELNDLVNEKRFMGEVNCEVFTVQELSEASKFHVQRLVNVMEALLTLKRVEIVDKQAEYRYRILK